MGPPPAVLTVFAVLMMFSEGRTSTDPSSLWLPFAVYVEFVKQTLQVFKVPIIALAVIIIHFGTGMLFLDSLSPSRTKFTIFLHIIVVPVCSLPFILLHSTYPSIVPVQELYVSTSRHFPLSPFSPSCLSSPGLSSLSLLSYSVVSLYPPGGEDILTAAAGRNSECSGNPHSLGVLQLAACSWQHAVRGRGSSPLSLEAQDFSLQMPGDVLASSLCILKCVKGEARLETLFLRLSRVSLCSPLGGVCVHSLRVCCGHTQQAYPRMCRRLFAHSRIAVPCVPYLPCAVLTMLSESGSYSGGGGHGCQACIGVYG